MSKKFVTEEQLSEVVDLIIDWENYTLDKVKALNETPPSGGGDAEALSEEEATELVNSIGGARVEADHVVNPPSL